MKYPKAEAPAPAAPALDTAPPAPGPAPGADQGAGLGSGSGSALPPAGDAALAHCAQQLLSELWQGSEPDAQQAAALGAAEAPLSSGPASRGGDAGGGAAQDLDHREPASSPADPAHLGDGDLGPACPDGGALRWLAALQAAMVTARAADKAAAPAGAFAAAFPNDIAPPRLGDAPALVLAALLAHGSARVAGAAARAAAAAVARTPLAGIGLLPVLLYQLQDRAARMAQGEPQSQIRLFGQGCRSSQALHA